MKNKTGLEELEELVIRLDQGVRDGKELVHAKMIKRIVQSVIKAIQEK